MEVRKKKSAIFWGVCIVGVIVLVFADLYACGPKRTYEEAFKNNWNIDLPKNMERIFYNSDRDLGEGIDYAVFKLETEPIDFLEDFLREKNEIYEEVLNKLGASTTFIIPENFLPDWKKEYYWKHVGINYREEHKVFECELYMFYLPDSLRLICYEWFT